MTLRDRLLGVLRVPPAPSAPAGDDGVRIFRAAPNYFRYQLLRWALKTAVAIIGLFVGVGMLRAVPGWVGGRFEIGPFDLTEQVLTAMFGVLEGAAIVGFAIQAITALALLRLDFEQRWYIVTDRSLRVREGLVRLHEKTMTFANIQHVTIRQGPLQRLLRIADLEVRTAGGGVSNDDETKKKDDLHVAYFRGVSNAAAIRDSIREQLRRHADSGLGDPDDVSSAQHPRLTTTHAPLLVAAHALLEEASLLRAHVTRTASPAQRIRPA